MHCGVSVLSITSKLITSLVVLFTINSKKGIIHSTIFCRTFQEETSDQRLKVEGSEASQVLFYLLGYKTVMWFGFYSCHSIFHIKYHATYYRTW